MHELLQVEIKLKVISVGLTLNTPSLGPLILFSLFFFPIV